MIMGVISYNFNHKFSKEELSKVEKTGMTKNKLTNGPMECHCDNCLLDMAVFAEERTCCCANNSF